MREVEVLHDYLLHLFQQDSTLTPKDIVVMVADIDKYTPYIQAVFGQYNQVAQWQIPFSISDNRLSEN
ncbi:exodeoxyribonuclease V, gamma subunit, partial [Pasteurella multocida subsp. multocida str. Anand1_cattle]